LIRSIDYSVTAALERALKVAPDEQGKLDAALAHWRDSRIVVRRAGYQVLRQLRADRETRHIKVILVSSKNQESDRFWGMKQGADDYIAKPYPDEALLSAVARQL